MAGYCKPHRHATLVERLEHYSIPEPNTGCILWCDVIDRVDAALAEAEQRGRDEERAAWMKALDDLLREMSSPAPAASIPAGETKEPK